MSGCDSSSVPAARVSGGLWSSQHRQTDRQTAPDGGQQNTKLEGHLSHLNGFKSKMCKFVVCIWVVSPGTKWDDTRCTLASFSPSPSHPSTDSSMLRDNIK